VALAPPNFGFFSNHLLIGNAGSGQIAVYDVDSGRFDDLPRDANGHAIQNDRLWALRFGKDHAARPSNWLYFCRWQKRRGARPFRLLHACGH